MYLAPELWNLDYSKKADVWSIGMLTFMILTGKYPYSTAKSDMDLKDMVLKTSIEDIIKEQCNYLSDDTKDFLRKAL